MSGTSSVPEPTFGPLGFVAPDESEILTGVMADTNAAMGGGLNPGLATPQGQLASSETAIIGNKNDQLVKLFNDVDPAYASGRMQDAIARIYFLERNPAEATVVQAVLSGLDGVVIPVGAMAEDSAGNTFLAMASGTIVNGSVTLPFQCIQTGPIPVPTGGLNRIAQVIPGWDSITNPAPGITGTNVESRAAFEERRAASVALNAQGSLPSVLASVLNVPGVLDAYATENTTSVPVTIGGYTLAPHSLYVAASGGSSQAIGEAIWNKKSPGCDTNGNISVTVTDPSYSDPKPTYVVKYEDPQPVAVIFDVLIADGPQVPSDAAQIITAAVIATFNGEDGNARERIGGTVYASRYYCPIAAVAPWVRVISVSVGQLVAVYEASITATVMTVTAIVGGGISVGQTVRGPNVAPGTIVTAGLTGTGGTGTYSISISQNVGSTTLTGGDMGPSLALQIDHIPTTQPSYIRVQVQ